MLSGGEIGRRPHTQQSGVFSANPRKNRMTRLRRPFGKDCGKSPDSRKCLNLCQCTTAREPLFTTCFLRPKWMWLKQSLQIFCKIPKQGRDLVSLNSHIE